MGLKAPFATTPCGGAVTVLSSKIAKNLSGWKRFFGDSHICQKNWIESEETTRSGASRSRSGLRLLLGGLPLDV